MDGYIKLHRGLIDSEIFASKIGLKIWVWLLLKASYSQRYVSINIGKGESAVKLERGELLFGRFKAEEVLNVDGSTIYKWLKKMELLDMIKLKSNNHYTIIEISNYNIYNNFENEESNINSTAIEQPSNRKGTTIQQPSNTYKKDKKYKKGKEDKEFIIPTFEEILKYATERKREDLSKKFFDYYSVGNWKDKDGKQIQNWKQKFITWENKNQQINSNEPIRNNKL